MPEVLRQQGFRFFFWSRENQEPPHIHVRRERMEAKFWLEPIVELASAGGFARHELNLIRRMVEENRELLLEARHEHFDQD